MPLLRERRLGAELHQATRSPVSEVFQQTLWIGGTCEEAEKQEVVPRGATRDRALRRSVPFSFALPSRPDLSPVCHRKSPEGSKRLRSATQSGMFSYFLKKRRNRRVRDRA